MPKVLSLVKLQAVVTAGFVAISVICSAPVLPQDATVEEEKPTVVESTIVGDVEPGAAVTVSDLTIPVEQLDLLVKPLTLEELNVEAAGWLLALKNKVQEISNAEIAAQTQDEAQKTETLVKVTELQGEQIEIIDRFNVVLNALDKKGGDTTSYRKYIEAISVIKVDLVDTKGLAVRLVAWITSEQGGIRLGLNIIKFVLIVIIAVIVSRIASKTVNRALSHVNGVSSLFRDFIVMGVNRGVLVVGGLIAITSLGVSLGPLLAVVGGASFVLAFALQSNLGNFASGLMLLINKPFDTGDEIKVCDLWGTVDSITLASTRLKGWNNQIYTIPNNTVWGGIIENLTTQDIRRAGFELRIRLDTSIPKVTEILLDIASSHPLVLDSPAPASYPWNYYEDHVLILFKVWAKTSDFWDVWIDLVIEIQERFKDEDIALALPQRNIYIEQHPEDSRLANRINQS